MTPVETAPSERCSTPVMLNASPRALLESQCFFIAYQRAKREAAAPEASSGTVRERSVGS